MLRGVFLITGGLLFLVGGVCRGSGPTNDLRNSLDYRVLEYLSTWDDVRNIGAASEKLRGELRSAVATRTKEQDLFARYEQLRSAAAVSTEEFNEVKLRYDVSGSRVEAIEAKLKAAELVRQRKLMELSFFQGAGFDLNSLYSAYEKLWASECELFKANVRMADAEVHYRELLFKNGERLITSQAMSHEEYVNRKTNYETAVSELEVQKTLDQNCLKDLPTLAAVKRACAQK